MGTKREYRSRIVVEGLDRAPHRASLRACGLDDDDLDKPRIGIVSTQGENTPCSMSLAPQAESGLALLKMSYSGFEPIADLWRASSFVLQEGGISSVRRKGRGRWPSATAELIPSLPI